MYSGFGRFLYRKKVLHQLKNRFLREFSKVCECIGFHSRFYAGHGHARPIYDFEGKTEAYPKYLLFDGGVRDHSPSNKILASDHPGFQVTETTSIFSRPDDIREVIHPKNFSPKNLLSVLERYTEIANAEVSKNDEFQEKTTIAKKGIYDHGTFYLPRIMQGVYDVDKNRLRELYEAAKKLVNDDTWNDGAIV